MPNGQYAEEVAGLGLGLSPAEQKAYVDWATSYYMPRLMRRTDDYALAQSWLQANLKSPAVLDYWQRFVKTAAPPTRDPYGLLSPAEYNRRLADYIERNVASGIWSEEEGARRGQEGLNYVAQYGVTLEAPFYYSLEQQVAPFTGAATRAEEAARVAAAPPVSPFEVTGAPRTRRDIQPRMAPAQAEMAIRAGLPGLPHAGGMLEAALEGQSPAMKQYFMTQFPYLFGKFGGEERRVASQVAYQKRVGRVAGLAEKRKGAQWVAEKKLPYAKPIAGYTSPFLGSYLESEARLGRLRGQEARARGRVGEWADPWERYLEQYPWLEEFIQVPQQQRGFFPARFAPFTRWL